MLLWRWDGEEETWAATELKIGQPVSVGRSALVLPVSARRSLLVTRRGARGTTEEVTVNGIRSLSLRVLEDRDEINVGGRLVYFAAESPPRVVTFARDDRDIGCGRCKAPLRAGESAVQCPRCDAWHHQSDSLGCWTYASSCSSCQQPTQGVVWQPEPLNRSKSWNKHNRLSDATRG